MPRLLRLTISVLQFFCSDFSCSDFFCSDSGDLGKQTRRRKDTETQGKHCIGVIILVHPFDSRTQENKVPGSGFQV
jgi:hypothetical protein